MTDRFLKRLPLAAALMLGVSLAACAQGEFVEEGSDVPQEEGEGTAAKALLIAMGAIPDPNADRNKLTFQARPPLVLPPQRTLPAPVDQDAQLSAKGFPVDPEAKAEQERIARIKRVQSGSGDDRNALSPATQAQYKDLPSAPAAGSPEDGHRQRPLAPSQLDGTPQGKALAEADAKAAAKAQATGAGRSDSLLSPPDDYRTPSSKAPLESPPTGLAAMKPGWWPF